MRDYGVRPPGESIPREKPPKRRRKRRIGATIANILTKVIALTILVLLLLVVFLPSLRPVRDRFEDYLTEGLKYYQEDPEYSEFKVERVMVMKSDTSTADISYTLSIPRPRELEKINKYDIQKMKEFTVTNSDSKAKTIENEDLYHWSGTLKGKGSVEVRITYHVQGFTVDWDISAGNSGKLSDIPKDYLDNYTIDRWEIWDEDGESYWDIDDDGEVPDYRFEPSNPLLNSLAKHIIGNEDNVYMCAYKIYQFMKAGTKLGNQTYGPFSYPTPDQQTEDRLRYHGKPKPAYKTLHEGYGDCDDQAILFLTLCRAVGIPGWLESGALFNQYSPDPDNAWEGHGWGKILIPMKNGKMEEPSVDPVNDLFLKRDANRFSDWQDPGGERTGYLFNLSNSYKQYLKNGAIPDVINKEFEKPPLKVTLKSTMSLSKRNGVIWDIVEKVGNDNVPRYEIQDFGNVLKVYEHLDPPIFPIDIESYYTSWTYSTSSSISPGDISFEDGYETHFYNAHKTKLEIKV